MSNHIMEKVVATLDDLEASTGTPVTIEWRKAPATNQYTVGRFVVEGEPTPMLITVSKQTGVVKLSVELWVRKGSRFKISDLQLITSSYGDLTPVMTAGLAPYL